MSETPLPVIISRSAGTAGKLGEKLGDTVTRAFADAGRAIALRLCEGAECAKEAATASGPTVVIGGGDGTLAGAAGELAGERRVLGILPLGTRNHLARQLGIPLDLAEAAKVVAGGNAVRIDVGRCNGRVFVNNASVGLYTRLVRERERRAGPKWLGTIPAAWHVLRHLRSRPFRLVVDGSPREVHTPLLFVGNNRYSLVGGRVGSRDSMTAGALSLYAVESKGALALIAFALRALVGRAAADRDFAALTEALEIIVEGSGSIDVALDGEVVAIDLPLKLEIAPRALEVIVPISARRAE